MSKSKSLDRANRGQELLRRYLERTGHSQESFAELCGMGRVQLNHVLQGRRLLRLADAVVIAAQTDGEVPADSWTKPANRH